MDRPLTRAEFATILYRLADQYIPAAEYEGHIGTGSVLSGDAEIVGRTVGDLWFDQSSSNIHLTDVTASSVTIRADRLESLRLDGTGKIGRLVLAAGTGDVALTLPDTYSLETLAVGEGTGAVSLAGTVSRLEVTGEARTISIDSSLDALVVSGSGNTISVKRGCAIGWDLGYPLAGGTRQYCAGQRTCHRGPVKYALLHPYRVQKAADSLDRI